MSHINHDRTDFHIQNLRWVSHSENNKNRTSYGGVEVEYFDELPDDAIVVTDYNGHRFENYYYSESLDRFIFDTGVNYRLLHINYKRNGSAFVNVYDVNNVRVQIHYAKFKRVYDIRN